MTAVVVAALALSGCFSQGIYSVGSPLTARSMPAGLWRSLGGSDCTWLRVDRASNAVVGRNVRTNGPQYMQLEPSDSGAAIGRCLPFWQQPGGFARPLAQPGSPFGDGDFLVGYEVQTGSYRATAGAGQVCSWAVVNGFHGKNASGNNPDQVRGGFTTSGGAVAVIQPGDYGFTSQGCGQWNRTGAPPPPTTTTNPPPPPDPVFHVSQEDFPDPFVLRVDNAARCGGDPAPCYYAFSTEAGFLGLLNVPAIRSSDLVNWKWAGPPAAGSTAARRDAMPTLAPWVTFGGNWAPSVIVNPSNPNQYLMYYTAKSKAAATNGRECVGVATASAPDGPYVDNSSQPLTCPAGVGDVIDPSTFTDSSNGLWLLYTDQFGLKTQPLAANGLTLTSSPTQILTATQTWENNRVEAPSMIQTAETGLLLFYSGNNFTEAGYAVGVARCTTPSSGCAKIPSSPVLTNSFGPGGQSPFTLGDGTTWRLAYHQWTPTVGYGNGGLRTLHIAPMTFSGTSPTKNPVVG